MNSKRFCFGVILMSATVCNADRIQLNNNITATRSVLNNPSNETINGHKTPGPRVQHNTIKSFDFSQPSNLLQDKVNGQQFKKNAPDTRVQRPIKPTGNLPVRSKIQNKNGSTSKRLNPDKSGWGGQEAGYQYKYLSFQFDSRDMLPISSEMTEALTRLSNEGWSIDQSRNKIKETGASRAEAGSDSADTHVISRLDYRLKKKR